MLDFAEGDRAEIHRRPPTEISRRDDADTAKRGAR
jgi:hypothetical protein